MRSEIVSVDDKSPMNIMISNQSYENKITFEQLQLNRQWSDVNFILNTDDNGVERIPAHKLVLANGSDVFTAMLFGELKETGDIKVIDASADAFKEFLQFFYSSRVCLTADNVAEVMNLGHKYNVSKCVDICVEFLKDTITVENVCTGLDLAILYDRKDLQMFYEAFFVMHAKTIFQTKPFLYCDKALLTHILEMDAWPGSTTMIFNACMAWIKARAQQDVITKELIHEHLDDLFYKIEFGKMTMAEFAGIVHANGSIFTADEYQEIIETIMIPGSKSKLFNGKLQQFHWNETDAILCDRKFMAIDSQSKSYNFLSNNLSTKFQTNQAILLGTLVFAPLCNLPYGIEVDLRACYHPIDVKIIESTHLNLNGTDNDLQNESARVLSEFKVSLPSRCEKTFTLPTPVLIQPQFYYEIRIEHSSTDKYLVYVCKGLLPQVQLKNNINFRFYGDRIGGSKMMNLLTGLGFNDMKM